MLMLVYACFFVSYDINERIACICAHTFVHTCTKALVKLSGETHFHLAELSDLCGFHTSRAHGENSLSQNSTLSFSAFPPFLMCHLLIMKAWKAAKEKTRKTRPHLHASRCTQATSVALDGTDYLKSMKSKHIKLSKPRNNFRQFQIVKDHIATSNALPEMLSVLPTQKGT